MPSPSPRKKSRSANSTPAVADATTADGASPASVVGSGTADTTKKKESTTTAATKAKAIDLTEDKDDTEMTKHKSGLFVHLSREENSNLRLRCLLCRKEVWHSNAGPHIKNNHPLYLAQYTASQSGTPITDHFKPLEPGAKVVNPLVGTAKNLDLKIADFLVTCKLALSTVDKPEFRDLLKTAMNFGAAEHKSVLEKYKLPSRRTLIEEHIEGPEGLLQEKVSDATARLQTSCETYGATLLFDGAKDANGKGLEVFMVQTGPHQALLWDGIPQDESKNTEWMKKNIRGLIEGNMNFETMTVLDSSTTEAAAELPTSSSSSAAAISSSSSTARVKRQKQVVNSHFAKLFTLGEHIFAMGGDNAATPVKASLELEKEIGVLPFGCVGHAFSRSYQHICSIAEIDENVISPVNDVVDLFLSRSQVREFLRAQCTKSVYRVIPTRFVSAAAVCERLQELRADLITVVDSKKFLEFKTRAPAAVFSQCERVRSKLHDDRFWVWISFFLKLSTGYVVAVRCMDGAKAGSACLVYKLWAMLASTVEAAFVEEQDRGIASEELFKKVVDVICKDWKKFHFPVYSAAYVLAPHFREEVKELMRTDPQVAGTLRDETLHCCLTFYRRFDETGKRRSQVLARNDEALGELRERLELDLEGYLLGEGAFKPALFEESQLSNRSPAKWWVMTGARAMSLLHHPAQRITSLSPSTTPVERLHKVHKANRTKTRNSLGYARALGLNFICCESLMANLPNDPELDWKDLRNYKQRFTELSKKDKDFLQMIEEEQESAARVEAEVAEEGISTIEAMAHDLVMATSSLVTSGVLTPDVAAEHGLEVVHQDSEEVGVSDSGSSDIEPGLGVEPINLDIEPSQEQKSTFGRRIIRRVFEGFVMG